MRHRVPDLMWEQQASRYASRQERPCVRFTARSEGSMQSTDLTNTTVLVTGGSGGIGREVALGFAQARARVLAVDLDAEGLRALHEDAARQGLVLRTQRVDVR